MKHKKDKTIWGVIGVIILIIGFVTMISFAIRNDPLYLIIISIVAIIGGSILMAVAYD
jgi:uncharacterized membrane protein YjjP (DUF1212 family)